MDEQRAFVLEIVRRLDGAGIPCMLTGSLALAAYAVPRMTRDIDLVVDVASESAERLAALFEGDCYVDREAVGRAISGRGMFNIIHNRWITKADFIVRKDDPYRKAEFARRRTFDLEGVPVPVVSPEDLILSKLLWSRTSASETQERDVRDLLAHGRDLHEAYLDHWAAALGVAEALRKLRTK